jgi:hypothetical protein
MNREDHKENHEEDHKEDHKNVLSKKKKKYVQQKILCFNEGENRKYN